MGVDFLPIVPPFGVFLLVVCCDLFMVLLFGQIFQTLRETKKTKKTITIAIIKKI